LVDVFPFFCFNGCKYDLLDYRALTCSVTPKASSFTNISFNQGSLLPFIWAQLCLKSYIVRYWLFSKLLLLFFHPYGSCVRIMVSTNYVFVDFRSSCIFISPPSRKFYFFFRNFRNGYIVFKGFYFR